MTQERKDQLYDEIFGWICERCEDSHELYTLLHEQFGMSKEELHDHCIESLDEFFPAEDAKTALESKIKDCYAEHYDSWMQMQPIDLIERAEEIASVQRMLEELPLAVTEEDAEYLLRFKDPLEVVADSWQSMTGSGTVVDEEMSHLLWELRDKQDAEQIYEMEPEYCDVPSPPEPHTTPQMTM